jgi:hypothetical protein
MTIYNEPKENCISRITTCALLAISSTFCSFVVIDTVSWFDGNICVRIIFCWGLWACLQWNAASMMSTAGFIVTFPTNGCTLPYLCTVLWNMFISDENKKNPVRARFFAPVYTGPGAHPASCTMGTGSFPGVKRPRRGADHLLAPRSWKSSAIPLLPL